MSLHFTRKILLLDDDHFMLTLNEHLLNTLGFHNIISHDKGTTALSWMDSSEDEVDLILLDLNMPVMDGVEFMRRLVERKYTGSIILVSGEDETLLQNAEKLSTQHKLNTLGYLHKPFTIHDIHELIKKWESPSLTQ